MSKNSKDDRVSKKNNYTQQILYDHLNLAERTCWQLSFFIPGATQRGPSMPATSAGFHTHSRPGVSYRTSTHCIHASSPGMAKLACSFDSSTYLLLYTPEQPDHCRGAMGVFEKEV